MKDTGLAFDYSEAFSRNIGWVTEAEQEVLKAKRVAIAGVGGVGGVHLLTLTRLGIGNFNISDLDVFELGNFNRQAGAYLKNIGRPKVEVMEQMAREINPTLDINSFPCGVTFDNIDEFLDGVDLYIDGLDFFVLDVRQAVFKACYERGIPAITAAPLGMGTALLCFMPGKMSFDEYFGMAGQSEDESRLRFLLGLSPSMLQMGYLADKTRVDLENQRGPSTPMACEMCAGVAATNSLKVLLNRGDVLHAPWGLHFDAYKNTLKKTWRPWGSKNPMQRLMLSIARKQYLAQEKSAIRDPGDQVTDSPYAMSSATQEGRGSHDHRIERILELARWAPSGDNTQPWVFEILDESRVRIHGEDTRDWCFYDLEGRASQLAVGALLETLAVSASAHGMKVDWQLELAEADAGTSITVLVHLQEEPSIQPSAWLPYVPIRSVQRRPLQTSALSPIQKSALEVAAGADYQILWIEGRDQRWDMAKLLFKSAKIRLTTEEGFKVHSQVIDWNSQYSQERIPDQAVGLDKVALKTMRWALGSWSRVEFLNRFMAGTWLPRLQLDLLPGYRCGAHFILVAKDAPTTMEDFLKGGQAMQRVWLEATRQGLQFQPEMTPLIFSQYAAMSKCFTDNQSAQNQAYAVKSELERFMGSFGVESGIFMGRVGRGSAPAARSIRKPLDAMWYSSNGGK